MTPLPSANGLLQPSQSQNVPDGDTVQFTAIPAPGHVVITVDGCGDGNLLDGVYTTAAVHGDCAVQATFGVDMDDLIFDDDFEIKLP